MLKKHGTRLCYQRRESVHSRKTWTRYNYYRVQSRRLRRDSEKHMVAYHMTTFYETQFCLLSNADALAKNICAISTLQRMPSGYWWNYSAHWSRLIRNKGLLRILGYYIIHWFIPCRSAFCFFSCMSRILHLLMTYSIVVRQHTSAALTINENYDSGETDPSLHSGWIETEAESPTRR